MAQAMDYVFGYSILNDVSARDLPAGKHNSQGSMMSKGLDTFSPFGPYITLKEDVPDPHKLEVYAVLDGERHKWPVPNGNTSFLTFTVAESHRLHQRAHDAAARATSSRPACPSPA